MDLHSPFFPQIAVVTLVALLGALALGWGRRYGRHGRYSLVQLPVLGLIFLVTRMRWQVRVLQRPSLAANQGAVIICNHCSSVDPMLLQMGMDRIVHWMVAQEYVKKPPFRTVLKLAEVIPAKRSGADTAATRQAIRMAEKGAVIGIFPEGRINMSEQFLQPIRPGAAMIAIKAGVPIIPCYITGAPYRGTPASPFCMAAQVTVQFGEAVFPPPLEDERSTSEAARQLICEAMTHIAQMAGHSSEEVTMAGRKWKPSEEELQRDIARVAQSKGTTRR